MAMLETIFTVFLMMGIAALTVWLFSRAIRFVFKLICNGIGGLCLLFLLDLLGFGIPINILTVVFTMFTGGFGVVLMLLFTLFF